MIPVLHVIDATADATLLQSLRELRDGLRAIGEPFHLCSVNGPAAVRAEQWLGERVHRAELRLRTFGICRLPAVVRRTGARLLHAWGVEAAEACAARLPETPLLLSVWDSSPLAAAERWIRRFPTDAAVLVPSASLAARLTKAGIAREWTVVVPPWLERRPPNRSAPRLEPDPSSRPGGNTPHRGTVLLLHGPPSRQGGQFHGMWAAAVLRQVRGDLRLVMPYTSREGERVRRLAECTRIPDLLIIPDPVRSWPDLLADADLFLMPALDEAHVGPLLAAMAAGVPIAASGLAGIRDWIEDEQEGLLFDAGNAKSAARQVLRLLEDPSLRRQLAENASRRATAIESPARAAERHTRIYQNILAGRSPTE